MFKPPISGYLISTNTWELNEPRHKKPRFFAYAKLKADQLSTCRSDQHLCFHYTDNAVPILLNVQNFKLLALFCGGTGWFMTDLVGNPKDGFS